MKFLEMPPIPEEAWKFIQDAQQSVNDITNLRSDILTAQAISGLVLMPDKYRRLVDLNYKVCQVGCSAIEWPDLFAELDASDMPEWEKQNVIDYKISTMLTDAGAGEFYGEAR
jgi:hypothetical protein